MLVLERSLAIRVDIDTIKGLLDGVPILLDMFDDLGIQATFFACVGPDKTSRSFLQAPRIARHVSVNPLKKFGLREIMGSIKGLDFRKHEGDLREIQERGHELQLHAFDHLDWINMVENLDLSGTRSLIERGIRSFEAITGRKPRGFACPAFRVTENVLLAEQELGFDYASDYHDLLKTAPFKPQESSVLQIPVNSPLIEDMVAKGLSDEQILTRLKNIVDQTPLTVFYLHPCYEPRIKGDILRSFIEQALEKARHVKFGEVWKTWSRCA